MLSLRGLVFLCFVFFLLKIPGFLTKNIINQIYIVNLCSSIWFPLIKLKLVCIYPFCESSGCKY